MTTRLAPSNIQIIGNELAIAWEDGPETFTTFEALRKACPCASCCGEPDAMGVVMRPEVRYTATSFELRGWQLIGGYALQPTWGLTTSVALIGVVVLVLALIALWATRETFGRSLAFDEEDDLPTTARPDPAATSNS